MSSTYSLVLAGLASALSEPASAPSPFANGSHSAEPYSPGTGLTSHVIPTLESSRPIALRQMEFPLMSSAEDSPAKTSPSPAKAPASMASDPVSGSNTLDSYERSDRFSQSLRTCLAFELSGLTGCYLTWKNLGTPRTPAGLDCCPRPRL